MPHIELLTGDMKMDEISSPFSRSSMSRRRAPSGLMAKLFITGTSRWNILFYVRSFFSPTKQTVAILAWEGPKPGWRWWRAILKKRSMGSRRMSLTWCLPCWPGGPVGRVLWAMIPTFCLNSFSCLIMGRPPSVPPAGLTPKSPQLDRCVEGSGHMWAKSLKLPVSLFP